MGTDSHNHTQSSPLLTGAEAAQWLRLCDADSSPDQLQSAQRTLQRLVQENLLRPVQPSKFYLYPLAELEAYVQREVERWPEIVREREARRQRVQTLKVPAEAEQR